MQRNNFLNYFSDSFRILLIHMWFYIGYKCVFIEDVICIEILLSSQCYRSLQQFSNKRLTCFASSISWQLCELCQCKSFVTVSKASISMSHLEVGVNAIWMNILWNAIFKSSVLCVVCNTWCSDSTQVDVGVNYYHNLTHITIKHISQWALYSRLSFCFFYFF